MKSQVQTTSSVLLVPIEQIGVQLSSSGMMIPRKSFSMVIGFGAEMPTWTRAEACARCNLAKTCRYKVCSHTYYVSRFTHQNHGISPERFCAGRSSGKVSGRSTASRSSTSTRSGSAQPLWGPTVPVDIVKLPTATSDRTPPPDPLSHDRPSGTTSTVPSITKLGLGSSSIGTKRRIDSAYSLFKSSIGFGC